ncbi:66S pre-ribosomal particles component [Komagataella phaffii CBS 7435]|uniref:Essential protein, constituent of 66S pre-ribosomal particles n=2 Tax=Komagataella phaffii TaxID=460519 RepID=C4R033_KOMPG|nr:uncharacterized protein PAS_chr2-1_0245 [Komagataella phaffii GS115]AOA62964.1 GQ67_00275T0 [Komagataella phaffii]CAH2448642.1 66S pre-ribosomal particles component [Komagataella phaffii CBS 7435]CAY68857.1 Essential protein, constituent of 66S pre-ribosomal particles [Komagataella phaffii GS115]CCA38736.1 66S pre-ribosomal particles component [Komagataella phaffii CBS 7435]
MSNSLEERLKSHASSFDGLLSLIPAKYYYEDSNKSNEIREQGKQKKKPISEVRQDKKKKLDPAFHSENVETATVKDVMRNREKAGKGAVIPGNKKIQVDAQDTSETDEKDNDNNHNILDAELEKDREVPAPLKTQEPATIFDDEGNEIKSKEMSSEEIAQQKAMKEKRLSELRNKLTAKINNMREKRKAPGTNAKGAPMSREQILAERKRKDELKKKRQQQQKEKEKEKEKEEDSDSDDDDEEKIDADVMFNNIKFTDGEKVSSDLSSLRKVKKKGPSHGDFKAHLQLLERQKEKFSKLDKEQQAQIQEKARWNKALAGIEGKKIKDDEKLLKKSLKRKEVKKRKSEKEWKDRKETIEITQKARQDKREENLRLRKENKGKKRKDQTRLKKFSGIVKPTRAGFEGKHKRK